MKFLLNIVLLFCMSTSLFSTQEAYQLLNGLWNAESDGDMDVILNVDMQGKFELSVIPAFEYTNMSAAEQSNIIQEFVSTEGYFKILKVLSPIDNGILTESEILLNGELSTNIINLTENKVFIYNTNSKSQEIFMKKASF